MQPALADLLVVVHSRLSFSQRRNCNSREFISLKLLNWREKRIETEIWGNESNSADDGLMVGDFCDTRLLACRWLNESHWTVNWLRTQTRGCDVVVSTVAYQRGCTTQRISDQRVTTPSISRLRGVCCLSSVHQTTHSGNICVLVLHLSRPHSNVEWLTACMTDGWNFPVNSAHSLTHSLVRSSPTSTWLRRVLLCFQSSADSRRGLVSQCTAALCSGGKIDSRRPRTSRDMVRVS